MKRRSVSSAEIAAHPHLSFSPRDYLTPAEISTNDPETIERLRAGRRNQEASMAEEPKDLTLADIQDRLPPIPEGSTFVPTKVEKVTLPHPFMIGTKHVAYASERGGLLTKEICDEAGPCEMRGCQLLCSEHETMVTLYVQVEDDRRDLNSHEGLGPWLQAVKDAELGLDGFAFPSRRKL